jgi:ceramide glucosyltransferase
VQRRHPTCDIAVVIDPQRHGANQKVGNLINMLPHAKYDVLAITDSDLHVTPDYLDRIVAPLALPDTGLVCTLYAGLPATRRLPGLLGASHITHSFLPGALLARVLGRQDSLGATMLLRRATLARIGGLEALADHLADDNALGRLVRNTGLAVRLADTVPLTTVPETRLAALFRHELRWARTIRALVPVQFVASALQYPLAWAALTILLSAGALWSVALFAAAWAARDAIARGIDRALGRPSDIPIWLLPLRDLMSVVVMIASYGGLRVDWRGHELTADGPAKLPAHAAYAEPEPEALSQR